MHSNLEKRTASPASRASADNQRKGISKPAVSAFNPVQKVASKEEEPVQGKFTPVVQRYIITDGEDAGRMMPKERGSILNFLNYKTGDIERADPKAFTAESFTSIKADYALLNAMDEKLGAERATYSVTQLETAKEELEAAYDNLVARIQTEGLKTGHRVWDAAVSMGVDDYKSLPKTKVKDTDAPYQSNRDEHYKLVAAPYWSSVGSRSKAMIDSFWKDVKRRSKLARSAASFTSYSLECDDIYRHMEAMYTAWDGSLTNRGAWWGPAATPGSPAGSRNIKADVISELKGRLDSKWVKQNSMSGGISFHRKRPGVTPDFIYHMQAS